MTSTVVGLYDQRDEAQEVVRELAERGFARENIQCVEPGAELGRTRERAPERPGAEPAGAEERRHDGIEDALRTYGLPDDMAHQYAEGVHHGGTLVTVRTPDEQADEAADILDRHHPIDIDERARQWGEGGWVAHETVEPAAPAAVPPPPAQPEPMKEQPPIAKAGAEARGGGEEERIPVVEEQVKVGKRRVEGGGVRVYSHVTERPVEEQVELSEEHVDVERRKVDRPVTHPEEAFQERTIEARESREEPVISKEARIIEEIVIDRETTERTETIRDTARRTDVDIERTGGGPAEAGYADIDESGDRAHFNEAFVGEDLSYEQARPAYRFGHRLATDDRFRHRDWSEALPEAKRMFELRNPGLWGRFEAAVRYGYEQTRAHLR